MKVGLLAAVVASALLGTAVSAATPVAREPAARSPAPRPTGVAGVNRLQHPLPDHRAVIRQVVSADLALRPRVSTAGRSALGVSALNHTPASFHASVPNTPAARRAPSSPVAIGGLNANRPVGTARIEGNSVHGRR